MTNSALVRVLPSVDEVMFLEVGELGESFTTSVAFERSLPGVNSQMNLNDDEATIKTFAL